MRFGIMRNLPSLVHRRRISSLALLVTIGCVGSASAQQTIEINGTPLCAACQVVLDSVVVLGDREGPGYVGQTADLARTSDGRWLVAHFPELTRMAVFESDGTFLRTVGRGGGGPGEYDFISFLDLTAGDTLRVVDVGHQRLSILSPTLDYVRSQRLELSVSTEIEFLPDGRMVTRALIGTDERGGHPLHLLGQDGRIVRSFGAENPTYQRAYPELYLRHIAIDSAGRGMWSAHRTQYTIELWDLQGQLVRRLVRTVPWFEPHREAGFRREEPESPPNPAVADLRVDAAGRLWVLLHVAGDRWREGLGPVPDPYGRPARTGVVSEHVYWDTVIEVIDPDRAQLVASGRFNEYLEEFRQDAYVTSYREDALGFPSIHVWRARLEGNDLND